MSENLTADYGQPWIKNPKTYFESIASPEMQAKVKRAKNNGMAVDFPSSIDEFLDERKDAKINKIASVIKDAFSNPAISSQKEFIASKINHAVELLRNSSEASAHDFVAKFNTIYGEDASVKTNAIAQDLGGSVLPNQLEFFLPYFITQPMRAAAYPFLPTIGVGGLQFNQFKLMSYLPGDLQWYATDELNQFTDNIEVSANNSVANIYQLKKGINITYLESAYLLEQNKIAKYPNSIAPFNPTSGFAAELAARMKYLMISNELLLDSVATIGSTLPTGQENGFLTNIVTTTQIPTVTPAVSGDWDTLNVIQQYQVLANLSNTVGRQSFGSMNGATLFVDLYTFYGFIEKMGPSPSNATLMNLLQTSGVFTAIFPVANWSEAFPGQATFIVANNTNQVWANNIPFAMGTPPDFHPIVNGQGITIPCLSRFSGVQINQQNGLGRLVSTLSSDSVAMRTQWAKDAKTGLAVKKPAGRPRKAA